jgi:hypothetical protein
MGMGFPPLISSDKPNAIRYRPRSGFKPKSTYNVAYLIFNKGERGGPDILSEIP